MGVYHTMARIHGFSKGVTLGLFWIVVAVAAESCCLLALLLLQDVWLLVVWSSGFVLLVCCSCGMKKMHYKIIFVVRGLH